MSSNDIEALLTMQMPKKDLNKTMVECSWGAIELRTCPKSSKPSGAEEGQHNGICGLHTGFPKIGNGFYQNLRGNYDPLTMDRWWMRFANRITGNPKSKICRRAGRGEP